MNTLCVCVCVIDWCIRLLSKLMPVCVCVVGSIQYTKKVVSTVGGVGGFTSLLRDYSV